MVSFVGKLKYMGNSSSVHNNIAVSEIKWPHMSYRRGLNVNHIQCINDIAQCLTLITLNNNLIIRAYVFLIIDPLL